MSQKPGNSNQNLERIGKLSIDKSLSRPYKTGENLATFKTQIFHGIFENKTMVCVRRYETASSNHSLTKEPGPEEGRPIINPIERDINVLQEPKHLHENFIRYFCSEEDGEFTYVATEWCICSVEDLYEGNKGTNFANEKIYTELIKKSLGEKEILRQATEGVAFLHALGFVHRNLKPSNFMIAQLQQFRCDRFRYLVKLSDFRMSKNPVERPSVSGTTGSKGWTYPDPAALRTEVDSSTYQCGDVFILGCFFHYVLTNGKHPFDDNSNTRGNNINDSKYFVYRDNWNPNIEKEAIALLKDMIKFQLKDICTLEEVFTSRYFSPVNFYQLYDLPLPIVKPGLCVIINQEIFETEGNNRTGTNFDENSLKDVFTQLGFDVRIFKDLKAKDLCYCVQDLAKQDFSSYASLVVCILSHGDEGVVEGVDGESIKINELKYKFNSNDCPTLNGKPKIWIIQACQGNEIQYPIQAKDSHGYTSSESDSGNIVPHPHEFYEMPVPIKKPKGIPEDKTACLKQKIKTITMSEENKKRPPLMDFLDIRASISGYPSFRGPKFGSYLIYYLCRELTNEYLNQDQTKPNQEKKSLEDILKSVQNHITAEKIYMKLNPNDTEGVEVKQTIEWRASLSDKIPLKKADIPGTVTNISISTPEPPQPPDNILTPFKSFLKNTFFSKGN
ncbi:uncharacterized protein LOC124198235 isoform X2 [Daphnia pulex]|uniref:uncharacterized protein LOC124198235 isoform X2 n=1 Tax=Daphnia pulex TaxID=6669 RepID=UPI001EE125E6|nr:uncharacterized protein LOC124198235 isoform X2 [Daphnia pulex]